MLENLKNNSNMKIMLSLGIIPFILLLIISLVVNDEYCLLRIYNAVDTAIGAFTGNHGYTLELIIEGMNVKPHYEILLILYIIGSVMAISFSVLLVKDMLGILYYKTKDGAIKFNDNSYVIFGYNQNALTMIRNTFDIENKKDIHIISLDGFDDEQINEIMQLGLSYDTIKPDSIKDVLSKKRFEKVKYVLLADTKEMRNYFIYKILTDKAFNTNDELRISCIPFNDAEQLAIENDGDAFVNMIGLKQTVAQSVASTVSGILCNNIETYRSKEIKCLMIGFGETGQNVFKVLVNQLVVSSDNKITIDIVDKDARRVFKKAVQNVCIEYKDDEGLHIAKPVANGILDVNIFSCTYNDAKCKNMLINSKYDFVVLNVINECKYVNFIENNRQLIDDLKNSHFIIPICQKDEYSIHIENSINLKNLHLSKAYETYNLHLQQINIVEENAIEFNYRYNDINGFAYGDKYSMWKDANAFNRKSSMFQSMHQNINDALRKLDEEECKKECAILKGIEDPVEIEEIINSNHMIRELAMIEHRRWTYFVILDGWEYSLIKNKKLKHSDCIIEWDLLSKNKPDVLKFDLTPIMVLNQKSEDRK